MAHGNSWQEVASARLTEAATLERRALARYKAEEAATSVTDPILSRAEKYERGAQALLDLLPKPLDMRNNRRG